MPNRPHEVDIHPAPGSESGEGHGDAAGSERIDEYTILGTLGIRARSIVYSARQPRPDRGRVAIEVFEQHLATPESRTGFADLRRVLSAVDHPHIARVFDGGVTDSGQPYFVTEFIRGMPLTEFCDDARLDLVHRLGLFVKTCHALEHAHRHSVSHLDIKPRNVLVALVDGKPTPKVIGFGMNPAHHSEKQLSETPEYSAPEQLDWSVPVDARADVYSLGALLHELATGAPPFRGAAALSNAEFLKAVLELRPAPVSSQVGMLDERSTVVAWQRGTVPSDLARCLRYLDPVVARCLEKDPAERYQSAGDLAEALERCRLAVAAHPSGSRQRLSSHIAVWLDVPFRRWLVLAILALAGLLAAAAWILAYGG